MYIVRLIIVIISLAGFKLTSAQSYYFRKYKVEQGLSNNSTICCLQDKKGFMWFGTKDGLNRFDGYVFKIFRNIPGDTTSIGNNFILSLYEDKAGALYVGTESGLYRYNQETETFSLIKIQTVGSIRAIQKDHNGYLWFIAGFTLHRYDENKHVYKQFDVVNFFEATSICVTNNGSVWISTSDGNLKNYQPKSDTFITYNVFTHSVPAASLWIDKIHATKSGDILVGTSNQGVKYFDCHDLSYNDLLIYNPDKTEIFGRNFYEISPNEFWIATEAGIIIYNLNTKAKKQLQKKINNPYSISDNAIYDFWKDYEGGVWVCTYFGGINYYPRQHTPFEKYFPANNGNSLSGNVVREIHGDNDGNLWIGTEDEGINKLNVTNHQFTNIRATGNKNNISYNNIHGLLVDDDDLWVGTFEHGLDILNIKTGKVTRHFSKGNGKFDLKSNFIYFITKLNPEEIVAGTTRGVYRFNRKVNGFTLLEGMPLNNWYTCIKKDHNGVVWAGTYGNGVNFFNTKTKIGGNLRYNGSDLNSLSSDRINSIFEDSNNNLWIATEGGLCKLKTNSNTFRRYTTKDGLPTNFILSILEDDAKNLWISTSKGLVRFSINSGKIVTYTVAHGLLNNQFNFNSAYKDRKGKMYFGSFEGMISFKPSEFEENPLVPPVYITNFQVFNKDLEIAKKGSPMERSITFTKKIVLNYDESTINIGFAALGYTAPGIAEYAYKMEGLDKNWTYLKQNRNAYFTNLSPGTYTFKVKASNSSGIWNENATALVIEIRPPWWASKTAYAIYIITGIVLIATGFRYYHNLIEIRNQRRFQQLENLKEKEVLQAKIDFFTNVAHEIRTPLTLIKAPLEKVFKKAGELPEIQGNLKLMEKNTTRLIDLTNQLLDFRQTEIAGFRLSFSKANITELLEEIFQNFRPLAEQKSLAYTLNIPSTSLYASIDHDAFNKILSNLLSNAVKYAETTVKVSLTRFNEEENIFTIEVRNDGYVIPMEMKEKIFEPFFRLKETQKQKGTGIGLALSRSLVQLHKGSLDLKETQNNLNIFSLSLPIQQDAEVNIANKAV